MYRVTPWRHCYRQPDGRSTPSAAVEESTSRQLTGPCIDCLRLRGVRVGHHESSAPGTASGRKFPWSFLRETATGVPSVASLSYTSPFLRPAGRRVRVCPRSRRCVIIARPPLSSRSLSPHVVPPLAGSAVTAVTAIVLSTLFLYDLKTLCTDFRLKMNV